MNICVHFVKNFVEFGTSFSIQEKQSTAFPVSKKRLLYYALFSFYIIQINKQQKIDTYTSLPDLLRPGC